MVMTACNPHKLPAILFQLFYQLFALHDTTLCRQVITLGLLFYKKNLNTLAEPIRNTFGEGEFVPAQ